MLKRILDLFSTKLPNQPPKNRGLVPAGRTKPTSEVFLEISRDNIINSRRIVHRTSPELARKIIRERQIFSHNSAVSFSVNPGQINQAEHRGAILVFEWSGPIRERGDARQDELLHVFSPEYVESMIDRPSTGKFLTLVGLIEPDLIEAEEANEDDIGPAHFVINDRTIVFFEKIVINVV